MAGELPGVAVAGAAVAPLPPHRLAAATSTLRGRSGGNPFFAHKLADSLRRNNLLVVHKDGVCRIAPDGDWVAVRVPPTLEVAVISDVARSLNSQQQLTLKIASVLGLTFDVALLRRVHPKPDVVDVDVDTLIRMRHLIDVSKVAGTPPTPPPPSPLPITVHR